MTSFLTRLKSSVSAFRNPIQDPILLPHSDEKNFPLPIQWTIVAPGRYQWSMIDYEAYAKEGFSQNEVVYGAIKYKFDSISQSPLRAYTGTPDKAKLIENPNDPLYALALRPNEYMSRVEFMQYCVTYLNLHGNCFVYLTGINDNLPLGMYPLRPDRVQIVPDDKKKVIGFLYYADGMSVDNSVPIEAKNMAHIKFPNPYDPLEGQGYGLSPMSAAARSIDTDNYMTMFLNNFFKRNGILPGGVIELPYEAEYEDLAKLREQFLDSYGGSQQWGKPIVVDNSGKYIPSSSNFKDMAIENIDLRNIRRSTTVLGVPARLMGLDEANSTYNNISEAKEDFWQRTMSAELMLFEEEFRHKVIINGDKSKFLRYDLSGIPAFAADTTSQIDNYVKLVDRFVPPDVAARVAGLELPPLDGGKVGYAPVSLTPVSILLEPPEPEPSPEPFADAPQEEEEEESTDKARQTKQPKGFYQLKASIMSFEEKEAAGESQDKIASRYEPKLAKSARKQFEKDKAKVMALFNQAKKSNRKARKSFDWNDFENSVRFYLYLQGRDEWSWEFGLWFVELAWDARDDWMDRLELQRRNPNIDLTFIFMNRETIRGEAWFADYTLRFAQAINKTTHEGIHAVIRDGQAAGLGTDAIGNKLELLFEQYMAGGTSPEDWAFMQERMPAYRTEMIARTETHGAMSASNNYFFQRTGASLREWLAVGDDRTRESHLQAWNRYSEGGTPGPIPFTEKFVVGGAEMRYPGDKSAPLKEFISCRCQELPYYPEED